MGLQEKRLIKDFQEAKLPGLMKEIQGFVSCPVEIDWDSLAKGDGVDVSYWSESWEKVYFKPILDGFKDIARDDMGRQALKDGIKKILICNRSESARPGSFSFDDGVLKIDHMPFTNVDDTSDRTSHIVQIVSKAL